MRERRRFGRQKLAALFAMAAAWALIAAQCGGLIGLGSIGTTGTTGMVGADRAAGVDRMIEMINIIESARLTVIVWLFIMAALNDLERMEIPDEIHAAAALTFALSKAAELFAVFAGNAGHAASGVWRTILSGICGGILIGGGMLILSMLAGFASGREALGGGDVKLFFVLGLNFGVERGMTAVVMSCVIGLLMWAAERLGGLLGEGEAFPFAPAIAMGTLTTAVAGGELAIMWRTLFAIR